MTYKEYFEQHPEANFTWCKPYTDETETRFLIMYDGEPLSIIAPGIEGHRHDGTLALHMQQFVIDMIGDEY